MTVWKNPCLQCGCGVSVYWPNCTCECHKGNGPHLIQWSNEEKKTEASLLLKEENEGKKNEKNT